MQLRESIAAQPQRQRRKMWPRFSGTCSFRDFSGSEFREIDHLVNCAETGRAMKYNA
jgi:hypothetical protein